LSSLIALAKTRRSTDPGRKISTQNWRAFVGGAKIARGAMFAVEKQKQIGGPKATKGYQRRPKAPNGPRAGQGPSKFV
jgi:hypothetical protein